MPRFRRASHRPARDLYDWLTLGVAIVGVLLVTVSTVFTAWQTALTRDELNTLIAQQRGWLRVDAQHTGPLLVHSGGAYLGIKLNVTNVGNAPVLNARGHTRLYPMRTSYNPDDPNAWVDAVCEQPEERAGGATVFPGETLDVYFNGVLPSRAEIEVVEDGEGVVRFVLTACVTYESAGKPHRTGLVYLVDRVGSPDASGQNFKAAGDAEPKDAIYLMRGAIGDVAD